MYIDAAHPAVWCYWPATNQSNHATNTALVHQLIRMVQLSEDGIGGFGRAERFGIGVAICEIEVDSGLEFDDRADDTAFEALAGELGENALPTLSAWLFAALRSAHV